MSSSPAERFFTVTGLTHPYGKPANEHWRPGSKVPRARVATKVGAIRIRRADAENREHSLWIFQSYISSGHTRTGHRLFCKEFLCLNTMLCRHMPLLVHFWSYPACPWEGVAAWRPSAATSRCYAVDPTSEAAMLCISYFTPAHGCTTCRIAWLKPSSIMSCNRRRHVISEGICAARCIVLYHTRYQTVYDGIMYSHNIASQSILPWSQIIYISIHSIPHPILSHFLRDGYTTQSCFATMHGVGCASPCPVLAAPSDVRSIRARARRELLFYSIRL